MKNRNYMLALALAAVLIRLISPPAWAAPAGMIVAWGNNELGQTNVPPGDEFVAIAAGINGGHALALRSDGSLAGWGYNYGDPGLGQGNTFFGQAVAVPGNDFKAIAAGAFHSLVLKTNGSLDGWGSNFDGNGNFSGQATVPAGNDFVAIDAGDFHSLALRSDGSLVAWGENGEGQTNAPAGNDFVAISAGDHHNLALKSDGSIVAWGDDSQGQVRNTPPGTNFIAIAAGEKYALALKSDGSIIGWGAVGATGHWNTGKEIPPDGTNFVAISAGYGHSLALKSDGSMAGWGSNYQFDDPDPNRAYYGQAIPRPGTNFVAIAASSFFSLAIEVQPPVLTIGQIGNNVVVSWSTNHSSYILEAKADLSSALNWSKITGTPTILGDRFVLTNSVTGGNQFFRLKR